MKQSEWKEQIEHIKSEILSRGKETDASEVLYQFSTRLSATILHFFSESDSFSQDANLTIDQKAFTHSLQLYDLQAVMRLVANYDVSKGLKVVLPGIEKSFRSLMVIPKLEKFTQNSLESTALSVYKFRLEDALSSFLRCSREDLYEEDVWGEKPSIVSSATKALRKRFFTERLRTLFSPNYRIYLILKNRYFLNRLKQLKNNSKKYKKLENRLEELAFKFKTNGKISVKKLEEKLDFRGIEQLVKEQISQSQDSNGIIQESNTFINLENNQEKKEYLAHSKEQKNLIKKTISIFENQIDKKDSQNHKIRENFAESIFTYEELCSDYAKPLKELSFSFCPVPECSSPYFRPRAEDYRYEFANFFRQMHGDNLQVIAESHNFTQQLLIQRGEEYNSAERWGMVSKCRYDEKSVYFRETKGVGNFLDRKTEWSILIQARLPFQVQLPTGNSKNIEIEKGKFCLFQIGTAFFDHGHKKKIEEFPDVFFKLMFGGHHLTRNNAVIHVERDPYFTTTLRQMWHCRGLIYLFLISISHRFAIEPSSSLQEFLVKALPESLFVSGYIPIKSKLPTSLKFLEDE